MITDMKKYEKMTRKELIMELKGLSSVIKKSEELLRKSEENANALLHVPGEMRSVMDIDYRILEVNKASADRLGKDIIEVVGKTIDELVPPDLAEDRKLKFREIIKTGHPVRFEEKTNDIWYDYILYPVFNEEGKVIKIGSYSRDITESKQISQSLREKETIMAKAEKIAHMGSWKWDLKKNKVIWSDELYNIFGLKIEGSTLDPEEIISKCIHRDDRNKLKELNEYAISEGKPVSVEYRIILPDGSEKISCLKEVSSFIMKKVNLL